MIDQTLDLTLFDRIVGTGSMSAAARELGLSLAVVSKRLGLLEQRLGVRLLNRTTRRQALTEEGQVFHACCQRILAEIAETERLMTRQAGTVGGVLRISAPRAFGRRHLTPLLVEFRKRHPDVKVHLSLSDLWVDLVAHGVDVAIRVGTLPDSSLVAQELAPNYRVLVASPDYLAQRGTPSDVGELRRHDCILFGNSPHGDWRFVSDTETFRVQVADTYVVDDGDTAHELALHGAGITQKSIWDVGDDIRAGRLLRVLPALRIPASPLHAVYPHSRHQAPRTRVFVEFVRDRLRTAWRWPLD
ncbi:LysR family transcriptional regulator [Pandoraea faecigallinarum]|uniref:LysR family transcriptional regulator n=1 Tax=Pandoraea faecigallinarum TaxID=656179 RepID=A0A0H3WR01_9BURK|nr:LysR family transcriptional regulator [Pandoraea faecigallinarum]AKM29001.1 LysR family transcriptional regulator [Pandoraea faecigallinarum]